ncbi:hypothetical protein B0T16DRAFT_452297 [Cercophora newfieldiana]|uniref:Uncharacterized protein n=1 Tax=Cercophora newfieldiana TaxID=92897 RepID=A0AA40CZ46_9PEZI|nr:hypothetical protein B0T16DRAFT_452297 [Cercophora newfieldiana]
MKFSAAVLIGFVSVAIASPAGNSANAAQGGWGCKPATYRCSWNKKGWEVCNTSGYWVNGGSCGWGQKCVYYSPSKSPYCINKH